MRSDFSFKLYSIFGLRVPNDGTVTFYRKIKLKMGFGVVHCCYYDKMYLQLIDMGGLRLFLTFSAFVANSEKTTLSRSTPVAQSAPRNLLTRWDVSSIPANGIFLTKN